MVLKNILNSTNSKRYDLVYEFKEDIFWKCFIKNKKLNNNYLTIRNEKAIWYSKIKIHLQVIYFSVKYSKKNRFLKIKKCQ